jgi:hypothetical protein
MHRKEKMHFARNDVQEDLVRQFGFAYNFQSGGKRSQRRK